MSRIILGVDPGLEGALAWLDDAGQLQRVADMPTVRLERNGKAKRDVDAYELGRLIGGGGIIAQAIVEQVGAMPGQGVSSMFAFGRAYGTILGVLAANFIPIELVAPTKWKRAMQVPTGKDAARARASQVLPASAGHWTRVKDQGRAEAALLALYGARVTMARAA